MLVTIGVLVGVGVLAAAIRAVAALSGVQERVDIGIQFGNPLARHQEVGQVEQIHKDLVTVTDGGTQIVVAG